MNCQTCKIEELTPGTVTVTHDLNGTTIVVREVPASVCPNCGDYMLDESIAERLYDLVRQAAARGVEVEILRFAA